MFPVVIVVVYVAVDRGTCGVYFLRSMRKSGRLTSALPSQFRGIFVDAFNAESRQSLVAAAWELRLCLSRCPGVRLAVRLAARLRVCLRAVASHCVAPCGGY